MAHAEAGISLITYSEMATKKRSWMPDEGLGSRTLLLFHESGCALKNAQRTTDVTQGA